MESVNFQMYFWHVALRDVKKKKNFVSKFWPQHRGTELGVSADIFGNYDVVYREGSERHEVIDSARSQVI